MAILDAYNPEGASRFVNFTTSKPPRAAMSIWSHATGLAAQKPHLLDKPLFGRVRLVELAVLVLHRAHDRRQSVAQTRMELKKAENASSLSFTVAIGPVPSIAESSTYTN